MNGVEFLNWALRRDPEMAVLMLTGLDLPDIAIECMDGGGRLPSGLLLKDADMLGAISTLSKPFELSELTAAVDAALDVDRH